MFQIFGKASSLFKHNRIGTLPWMLISPLKKLFARMNSLLRRNFSEGKPHVYALASSVRICHAIDYESDHDHDRDYRIRQELYQRRARRRRGDRRLNCGVREIASSVLQNSNSITCTMQEHKHRRNKGHSEGRYIKRNSVKRNRSPRLNQ